MFWKLRAVHMTMARVHCAEVYHCTTLLFDHILLFYNFILINSWLYFAFVLFILSDIPINSLHVQTNSVNLFLVLVLIAFTIERPCAGPNHHCNHPLLQCNKYFLVIKSSAFSLIITDLDQAVVTQWDVPPRHTKTKCHALLN